MIWWRPTFSSSQEEPDFMQTNNFKIRNLSMQKKHKRDQGRGRKERGEERGKEGGGKCNLHSCSCNMQRDDITTNRTLFLWLKMKSEFVCEWKWLSSCDLLSSGFGAARMALCCFLTCSTSSDSFSMQPLISSTWTHTHTSLPPQDVCRSAERIKLWPQRHQRPASNKLHNKST